MDEEPVPLSLQIPDSGELKVSPTHFYASHFEGPIVASVSGPKSSASTLFLAALPLLEVTLLSVCLF